MNPDFLSTLLIIIFLISVIGVLAIAFWLMSQSLKNRLSDRVGTYLPAAEKTQQIPETSEPSEVFSKSERLGGLRGSLNRALTFFSTRSLQLKISSAYWPITDVEFIFIRILAVILGVILGTIIPKSIIGGIGLGIVAYLVPGFLLDRAILTRRKKFQDQLLDFLILIKGAVLAGYSLQQALDLATRQVGPPANEEFGRVLREVRFGFPLEQALINLRNRMQSDDLQIVVTAIVINSQVGGNLSTVLEATIDTIRERIHLFSEIRSMTSYARFVGNLLSFLPFITALLIFFISPGYFDNVKDSLISQIIYILALTGILIGNILIRRIVKIKV